MVQDLGFDRQKEPEAKDILYPDSQKEKEEKKKEELQPEKNSIVSRNLPKIVMDENPMIY